MILSSYLKTAKIVGIVLLAIGIVWLYEELKFQKSENIRQTENASQLRKFDSLRFASQLLSKDEINDYLEYDNKELNEKIKKDKINPDRIKSIVSSDYSYKDTASRETDVSGLIAAIKNSIPKSQKWIDSTKCLTTKGIVEFNGDSLKVIVNSQEFKNKSDAIAYWERRKWKFLFIKSRLFGKKEFTSKNYDQCGESRIMKIEKKE